MCILIFQTCLLKRILSIYIVKFRLYYVATIIDPGSTRVGLGWVWPGSGLTWGGSDPGRVWHEAGQTRVGFWPKWVWPGSGPNPTQPDPLRPLAHSMWIRNVVSLMICIVKKKKKKNLRIRTSLMFFCSKTLRSSFSIPILSGFFIAFECYTLVFFNQHIDLLSSRQYVNRNVVSLINK